MEEGPSPNYLQPISTLGVIPRGPRPAQGGLLLDGLARGRHLRDVIFINAPDGPRNVSSASRSFAEELGPNRTETFHRPEL